MVGVVSVAVGLSIGIAPRLARRLPRRLRRHADHARDGRRCSRFPACSSRSGSSPLLGPGLVQIMIAVGVDAGADLRAAAARLDPRAARERLRACRAFCRGARPHDPRLAHPPERDLARDRAGDARARDGDHRRRRPGLPRPRHQDPARPEWGAMLTETTATSRVAPFLAIIPGVAIVVSVLGFNLIGDALREALDPKLRGRDVSLAHRSRTCASSSGRAAALCTRSTGVVRDRARARRSASSASPAAARASRRSRCSGSSPRAGRVTGGTRVFEGEDLIGLPDSRAAEDPRHGDRDDLPGPDDVAEPGADGRAADPRVARDAFRPRPQGGGRARRPSCSTRSGIPEREARVLDDYPHQFSGGMRQRAMIAMALACEPKLLIADEPTTALDVTIQAQILDLLRALVAERDTALVLITHDLGVVAGMCERVHVMYGGMFMETGPAEQVFALAAPPVHAGAAADRAAARHAARPEAASDRGRAARHAQAAVAPARSRRAAHTRSTGRGCEVPPLVEIEPGHHVACFNPVPEDAWLQRGGARMSDGRSSRSTTSRSGSRSRAGSCSTGTSATSRRSTASSLDDRARGDARARRRVGLRQVDARPRDPAPLRADRGPHRLRRPGHHASRTRTSCARCAGGCRWSSRIRSRR